MASSMWHLDKWRKFFVLPGGDRGVVLQAFVLLPVISTLLRVIGFNRTESFLDRLTRVPRDVSAEEVAMQSQQARRVASLVRAAARNGFGKSNCLEESVLLSWMLRRQGIDAELRIGVCKQNRKFEAHAWVAFAGIALNETDVPHERFAAFDPPSRRWAQRQ